MEQGAGDPLAHQLPGGFLEHLRAGDEVEDEAVADDVRIVPGAAFGRLGRRGPGDGAFGNSGAFGDGRAFGPGGASVAASASLLPRLHGERQWLPVIRSDGMTVYRANARAQAA